ncbi:exodeoxyribonuclease III, partial [Campylobacter jejuni]
MKLLSLNVNCLRDICDKNAFYWIAQKKIDFIGFQEIKAHEEKFPKKIYEYPFKH